MAAAETGIIIRARRLRGAVSLAGDGGSHTGVFVVLGVIVALLVISCLVRQVCTKKRLRSRPPRDGERGLPRWRPRR
jgi:hypothetical protein